MKLLQTYHDDEHGEVKFVDERSQVHSDRVRVRDITIIKPETLTGPRSIRDQLKARIADDINSAAIQDQPAPVIGRNRP